MSRKEGISFISGGHTFIYVFWPSYVGMAIRRVYVDSRHPELGFSLALVFTAMRNVA